MIEKKRSARPGIRLLAVDVDGTLLHHGRIAPTDAEALHAAAGAGMVVCLCTGRSWREVKPIWAELALPEPHAPVVCVGGAVVSEPDTGRTLYSRCFRRPEAAELSAAIAAAGYPVMALVDAWREGFDYYVLGTWEDRPLYRRFFGDRDELRIRRVEALGEETRPVLRISALTERDDGDKLVGQLQKTFSERIEVQRIHLIHRDVHIVEAFADRATKLSALVYVGQGMRIAPAAMAAIGDDHNDTPMLAGAGLSAAPADSAEEVRDAADLTVAARGGGAVAEFVEHLLGDQA